MRDGERKGSGGGGFDPENPAVDSAHSAAVFTFYGKLWTTDETRTEVTNTVKSVLTLMYGKLNQWHSVGHIEATSERYLDCEESMHRMVVMLGKDHTMGCLHVLIFACRLGRELFAIHALCDPRSELPVSNWRRWVRWAVPGKDSPSGLLRQYGLGDPGLAAMIEDGYDAVDNRLLLLERFLLQCYGRLGVRHSPKTDFAWEVRDILSDSAPDNVHRRLFRWFRQRAGGYRNSLWECPSLADHAPLIGGEFTGERVGRPAPAAAPVVPAEWNAADQKKFLVEQLTVRHEKLAERCVDGRTDWLREVLYQLRRKAELLDTADKEALMKNIDRFPAEHRIYPDPNRVRTEHVLTVLLDAVDSVRDKYIPLKDPRNPTKLVRDALWKMASQIQRSLGLVGNGPEPVRAAAKDAEVPYRDLTQALVDLYPSDVPFARFCETLGAFLYAASVESLLRALRLRPTEFAIVESQRAEAVRLIQTCAVLRRDLLRWADANGSERALEVLGVLGGALGVGIVWLCQCAFDVSAPPPLDHFAVPSLKIKMSTDRTNADARPMHAFRLKMLGFVEEHVTHLTDLVRAPVAFRDLLRSQGGADLSDLLRRFTHVSTGMPPDNPAALELWTSATAESTNTGVLRRVREWLRTENYGERAYVAENVNRKRPLLAAIERREIFDP